VTPGGCRSLPRRPLTGTWYRAVTPDYFADGLGFVHTVGVASRFNPGPFGRTRFAILYLAEDHPTALAETRATLPTGVPARPVVPNPVGGPMTIFPAVVSLGGVVDLCDPDNLDVVGTSVQEMTGDWVSYQVRRMIRPAPTQELGAALFKTPRVEAFLTYSARDPTRRNLIVFPTRLRPESSVAVTDPATGDVLLQLPEG
jgi:hypothetical protein